MNKQEFSNLAAVMKAYYPQDWFIPDKVSMTAWFTGGANPCADLTICTECS